MLSGLLESRTLSWPIHKNTAKSWHWFPTQRCVEKQLSLELVVARPALTLGASELFKLDWSLDLTQDAFLQHVCEKAHIVAAILLGLPLSHPRIEDLWC